MIRAPYDRFRGDIAHDGIDLDRAKVEVLSEAAGNGAIGLTPICAVLNDLAGCHRLRIADISPARFVEDEPAVVVGGTCDERTPKRSGPTKVVDQLITNRPGRKCDNQTKTTDCGSDDRLAPTRPPRRGDSN